MAMQREKIVEWVAGQVLPHEREVRSLLRSYGSRPQDIDDILQDAYVQISRLDDVGHIADGRTYLIATARTVMLQRVRRDRIVSISQLVHHDALAIADEAPDPERRACARRELERVLGIISRLSPRSRQVIQLRRIEGLSQRAIAERLGITEGSVEQEIHRGLRKLLHAIRAADAEDREPSGTPGKPGMPGRAFRRKRSR